MVPPALQKSKGKEKEVVTPRKGKEVAKSRISLFPPADHGLTRVGSDATLESALRVVVRPRNGVKPFHVERKPPKSLTKERRATKTRIYKTLGMQPYAQQNDEMESNIEEVWNPQRAWDRLGNAKRLMESVYNDRLVSQPSKINYRPNNDERIGPL